ncbi:MAG TPA: hypothetical protein VFN67_37005 [Polyangiales bacterium]|nr:hypothetical protein [Polyangiales bacterium]
MFRAIVIAGAGAWLGALAACADSAPPSSAPQAPSVAAGSHASAAREPAKPSMSPPASNVATAADNSKSSAMPAAATAAAAASPSAEVEVDADAGVAGDAMVPEHDAGAAAPACTPNAYVSNSFADSVSVIDTNTHKVVATIPTGTAPVNPVFTPDRQKVYVSNSQADTLTVIDVATNRATMIPAGSHPSGLAFSPDGQTLYVSLIADFTSPGAVLSIDLGTGQASAPIPMGADPERIALTPDGKHLYVNNLLDGTMAVVDTESRKVVTTLMLGDLPFNPLLSPDGALVYVGVMSANHIAVIDTQTNQVVRTIPADSPNGMTYSKGFESLFVSNALSGTVQQVSLTTNMILKTAEVGGVPGNMAVLPDGKHAYMVRPDGSTVEILDTSTLEIVDTIEVGMGPSVVTVCRPAAPPVTAMLDALPHAH